MANAVTVAKLQSQAGRAFGGNWGREYALWQVFNAEPVNAQAAVESVVSLAPAVRGFTMQDFTKCGLWIKGTSGTNPNIAVNLLQSFDDVVADYALPAVNGIIAGAISDQNVHIYSLGPTPMPWFRLQLVGNGPNPADTTVNAFLFLQ